MRRWALHNRTRIPEIILRRVLDAAHRTIGIDVYGYAPKNPHWQSYRRPHRVLDEVTVSARTRSGGSGTATAWAYRYKITLGYAGAAIVADGGWWYNHDVYRIGDIIRSESDALVLAERFFDVAIHEAFHCLDTGETSRSIWGRRRPAHNRRPEEIRAYDAVNNARQRGMTKTAQEAVLHLALWLDAHRAR